jgi:hypothetical protein
VKLIRVPGILLIALMLFAHPARAQQDTFTQNGTWSCEVGGRWSAPPAPPPVTCPTVNFPAAFGGAPTTTVTACYPGGHCVSLSQDAPYVGFHVTSTGFAPYLSHMGRGAGASVIVTGTWIAVGPKVPLPLQSPPRPQEDTFTQNGNWTCDVGGTWSAPPAPPPVTCPTINFPAAFGGIPSVTLAVCYPGGNCDTLFQDAPNVGYHVTATGFSPYLSHMGRGAGASVIVTGTWVAVGRKVPLPAQPPQSPPNPQDDTFTQNGAWTCDVGGQWTAPPAPPPVTCPTIKFPSVFGETPTMTVGVCYPRDNCAALLQDAPNVGYRVTRKGFEPYLSHMGRGDGSSTIVNGTWLAVGPKLHQGTATARYIVLTVIYAPPGTNGGHSSSSVSYSAGSTAGTTTSASQSFKLANSLSFEGSGGFLGNGGGAGLSFDWSHSSIDTQSLDIKKSTTSTINRTGPSQDGVDHDEDAIYLLLNPTINLDLSTSSARWALANTRSPIQYVYVGWLNGHVPMPANISTALSNAGISTSDYADILARDPLANGANTLDPARFAPVNTTFPYEPPYTSTDPVPTITTNITDSSTQTVGTEVDDTYKVGLSVSTTGDYLEFAKATLKDTASWEWTNKSSTSNSTGTVQTASVTVGGPAFGYTGPTLMEVYIDTVYHTFAFAVVPVQAPEASLKGTVVASTGTHLAFTEVILTANGVKHRTFTNSKGEYVFWADAKGAATVQAAGVTRHISDINVTKTLTIQKK